MNVISNCCFLASSAANSIILTVRKPPIQVAAAYLLQVGLPVCCLYIMQAESESESGGHEKILSQRHGISAIAISCSMRF